METCTEETIYCPQCRQTLPRESFLKGSRILRTCRACRKIQSLRSKAAYKNRRATRALKNRLKAGYAERDKTIRELGYANYAEYLRSPRWYKIRRRVWKKKGRDCSLCGEPATELHHASYERAVLLGARTTRIYPVCRACHVKIEFDSDGRKKSVREAIFYFDALWKIKCDQEREQRRLTNRANRRSDPVS